MLNSCPVFLDHYSRAEIDELLLDKLSNVLSQDQKRTKIRNLLYEMSKKEGIIVNQSASTANPVWVLTESKNKIGKDKK